MNRPQVRMIEDQQIENKPIEVSGWEAEQLLRKYGHEPQQFSTRQEEEQPKQGLTFEEMVAQEEERLRREENLRRAKMNGPKPTTFDGSRGYDSEVKYGTDDDSGFNFRIEITTDMKIPKY